MATMADVARIALALPHVTEGERYGNVTWYVTGKAFAWDRPFSQADLRRFGEVTPPDGPIVAIRTEDLSEKEALLAGGEEGFFTIPHFDGYAAVLLQLNLLTVKVVRAALTDAWLASAPRPLAEEYLGVHPRRRASG